MTVEKGKVGAPEIGRFGVAAFAFASCVNPVRSALQAATVAQL